MRIKYFSDTDTALLELTGETVAETIEIREDVYADLDEQGRIVSLTIEHARKAAEFRQAEMSGVE
jgi:uncharacterized protein YuzE